MAGDGVGDEVADDPFVVAETAADDCGARGRVIDATTVARDIGLEVGIVFAQIVQQAREPRRSTDTKATTERLRQFRHRQQMFREPLPVPFVTAAC